MPATMKDFIGHLHPLLVHLPIGILLLANPFALRERAVSTVAPHGGVDSN